MSHICSWDLSEHIRVVVVKIQQLVLFDRFPFIVKGLWITDLPVKSHLFDKYQNHIS